MESDVPYRQEYDGAKLGVLTRVKGGEVECDGRLKVLLLEEVRHLVRPLAVGGEPRRYLEDGSADELVAVVFAGPCPLDEDVELHLIRETGFVSSDQRSAISDECARDEAIKLHLGQLDTLGGQQLGDREQRAMDRLRRPRLSAEAAAA